MDKWEYLIDTTTREHSTNLAKLGELGWELITVIPLHLEEGFQDYKHIFKRRKSKWF